MTDLDTNLIVWHAFYIALWPSCWCLESTPISRIKEFPRIPIVRGNWFCKVYSGHSNVSTFLVWIRPFNVEKQPQFYRRNREVESLARSCQDTNGIDPFIVSWSCDDSNSNCLNIWTRSRQWPQYFT